MHVFRGTEPGYLQLTFKCRTKRQREQMWRNTSKRAVWVKGVRMLVILVLSPFMQIGNFSNRTKNKQTTQTSTLSYFRGRNTKPLGLTKAAERVEEEIGSMRAGVR